jgi:hypothetical protein
MQKFRPARVKVTPQATRVSMGAADRWLDVHTRFAPFLWLLGILHASAAAMMLTSAVFRRWPQTFAVNLLIWLWLATGVFQALASVLNGMLQSDLQLGMRNALSFTAIGWLFAAMGIATGAASSLTGPQAARLYARLAVYTLVLGILTLTAAHAGFKLPSISTPVSMISSTSEVLRQYGGVKFLHDEITLGSQTTRLVLMYPWAPALGIGSLGLLLISSRCDQLGWRVSGMAGGLLGVIFSWSRLAVLAAILAVTVLLLLRSPVWLRVAAGLTGAAALALAMLFGFDPFSLADQLYGFLGKARAGSTLARDIIVDASWAGFLRSPWIGNGWIGESVHSIENLPIGSHSTVYGTLYTGGVLVFTAFALAMTAMLGVLVWRLAREKDSERRKDVEVAVCLAVILCVAARYESIYSLSLPCFFYFAWIGASAGGLRAHPASQKSLATQDRNRMLGPGVARHPGVRQWGARRADTDIVSRGITRWNA